ncbi:unnamed protein product, partial [Porites evermanni]
GRILKLKSSLVPCLQKDQIVARDLASISTGKILSMTCAVGTVARLFTRNCHAAIERRTSWARPLNVSSKIRTCVLKRPIFYLAAYIDNNGRVMSPKSSAVGAVYADAN